EVARRTAVESALRQSQKMEAIGQLTGGVAHDFNNLLHVILANLDLIKEDLASGDGPGQRQGVARLLDGTTRSAERAATLTRQLLAFARQQPLAPRPLDVNRLVSGMSQLLQRTLAETIRLETVLASELGVISADANQLESAILNLAINARDATPGF